MDIRMKEAVRYLGYKNHAVDERTLELIQSCFKELEQVSSVKYIYRIFEISQINTNELIIGNCKIQSKNLCKNLQGCHRAIFLCATLGTGVDRLIKKYSVTNIAKASVHQACATVILEEYCDEIQKEISEKIDKMENLRPRFSPGYGDFSIMYQKELLKIMDASKKIGLSMTEGYMLTPTKSITAVLGISFEKTECHINGCELCLKKDCSYRRSEN